MALPFTLCFVVLIHASYVVARDYWNTSPLKMRAPTSNSRK